MLRLRCSINCLNSSPDALRGTLGRRKGAEVSPGSVARHPWAAERVGSVAGECCAAPLGGGKGRKCHRRVSRGTLGQRKGAEVSPESVAWHPWAAEKGGSVTGECRAAPLGSGKGRKCHRRVSRGTLGQRKGTKVSPESVAWHPWATERGGSVTGECRAAPLGNGKGRKCRRRVSRGTLGQRKGTKVSPESVARHPWATERDGSVAGECRAAPLGGGKGRKCRRGVSRGH